MRKNNFSSTSRQFPTTSTVGARRNDLTYTSKVPNSKRVMSSSSNLRTSESRFKVKQLNMTTTSVKYNMQPISVEKGTTNNNNGTIKRKTIRNSTALRGGSNYQEKEYIVAIIENYAREVVFY
jgi:hypothetical protein